jgi:zinc protease
MKHVTDATPKDIQGAAKRWLSDGQFVLEVHPFPDLKPATTSLDRSKMPDPGTPPDSKFPKLERTTLSNGMKVILAERHDLPLVNFWMLVDAGYAADQFANPGTASLAMKLLTNGTKTRDALQISDDLRALGAQANASSSLDASFLHMVALKPKLDPSLDLFADIALNPTFPESELQRERKQTIAAIQREKSSPFPMALRVFPSLIYGKGHAYSNPMTGSGTVDSVSKISRAELVKFHQTWFHPNATTLIVVGDTAMSEIQPKLERQFSNWKPAEVPKKNLGNVAMATKPTVYLVDRPGALQSVIMAGHVAPPRNNPQEIPLAVLNDIVGGSFGSRLNMNLREDKHWSYGVFSMLRGARGQSPFITLAPVQTDKTKESMAEMNRELREVVSSKPITDAEVEKEKSQRILSLAGSKETSFALGQSIQQLVSFGFPDNYYDTYPDRIRALNAATVEDAAKSMLHPDSLVWVVVGDRAKVEKGIRELNIGEVKIIDADGNPQ